MVHLSIFHRTHPATLPTVASQPASSAPADPVDGLAGSVAAPVKDPRQTLRAARIDQDVAKDSEPVGIAAGLLGVALAPLTAGLSLVPALGLPLLAREVNRVATRRSAEGDAFEQRLDTLQHQLTNPASFGSNPPFKLSPDEQTVLAGLVQVPGGSQHLSDFFDGAYLRINDGGRSYDQWSQLSGVHTRVSSHASDGKQYEMDGRLTGPVLFGKTADGKATWVQMERDSGEVGLKAVVNLPYHLQDFVQYKLTHRNQSRYGTSSYTDRNPLILQDPESELS